MYLVRRWLFGIVAILSAWQLSQFFTPRAVLAFFPTNWRTLGDLLGTSHQLMTETAIERYDQSFYNLPIDFFGTPVLTVSMKTARDAIVDANEQVDLNDASYVIAANHFDGEQFAQSQQRLIQLRAQIVNDLNANDGASARTHFGQALHTLQDFYAHSNWVENGNTTINANLGVLGMSVGAAARPNDPTCQSCTVLIGDDTCAGFNCLMNVLPALINNGILTTGYYGGEPAATKPELASGMKCNHGGPFDTLGWEGINKDSTACNFSPHYAYHPTAASLATAATSKFLDYIFQDLGGNSGRDKMNLLLGGGPTLVFVIDTTGSMSDIQSEVLQQTTQSVKDLIASDTPPSKYVLVPFNDPTSGPVIVSTDPDAFINAIAALPASGGDDCPELPLTGILQGIAASDDGAQLFMFSDANAKDTALTQQVVSAAIKKHVQINPINFVDDCSTGSDPVYSSIASQTGGKFYYLARNEAANITSYVDFVVSNNLVNVLTVVSHLSSKSYTVPVDSTMTRVSFSVSGPTGSITSSGVSIVRPDGTVLRASDSGVNLIALSTGAIWSVTNPVPGNWTINLTGSGNFTLNVTANSSLTLTSFRFVAPGGRAGHQGYFPISGNPVQGQTVAIDAVVEGTHTAPTFQLLGLDGTVIQNISLGGTNTTPPGEYVGTTTLPNVPFVAYIKGIDDNGNPYSRAVSGSVNAQTVSVTPPSPQNLYPATATSVTFTIQNTGAADTFTVVASDSQGYLTGFIDPAGSPIYEPGSPSTAILGYAASIPIEANESKSVTLQLKPGATAQNGATDSLTLTATGSASSSTNYAILNSSVTSIGEPLLGGSSSAQAVSGDGQYYVDYTLSNSGKGVGGSTVISSVTMRTLTGAGTVSNAETIPISVGDIPIGGSATVRLFFNVPMTVNRFSFTVNGTTFDPLGTPLQFSLSQAVIPQR